MATYVIHADAELEMTRFIRGALASTRWAGSLVSNRLRATQGGDEQAPRQDFAVIVRCDGGSDLEHPTALRRFGLRFIGPAVDDTHERTSELARHVIAALQVAWRDTDHVADLRNVFGPYRVPATVGRPEMYATCELVFVGDPITL